MTEERALIDRAARGDAGALDALAGAHRPVVRRTALSILGDEDAADDVAQEVFVRLQTSLAGFRQDAALATWLYRITLNLCRDRLRRIRRDPTVALRDAPDERLGTVAPDDEAPDVLRARAAVRAALDRLPEAQREVLMLRYLSDLPYAEIARRTGLAPGTVASRVFRGLARLGEELDARHLEVIK